MLLHSIWRFSNVSYPTVQRSTSITFWYCFLRCHSNFACETHLHIRFLKLTISYRNIWWRWKGEWTVWRSYQTIFNSGVERSVCTSRYLTLMWYHGVYVTPVLFDSRFFKTVTNTDIAFYVFFRKAFLTLSHTFASFCVVPFIFYICLFPPVHKWTPQNLPRNIDNIFLLWGSVTCGA